MNVLYRYLLNFWQNIDTWKNLTDLLTEFLDLFFTLQTMLFLINKKTVPISKHYESGKNYAIPKR